jgi:chromosomal replication initiation ATPase DnaA
MQASALYDPIRAATPEQRLRALQRQQRLNRFAEKAVAAEPVASNAAPSASEVASDASPAPDTVEVTASNGQSVTVTGEQIAEAWALFERMGFDGLNPTVGRITREVCRYFNIPKTDLISSRRTKNLVIPRQVAMYLAKTLTLKSLPEIGRRMGDRDHTTVLHAVRKMGHLVGRDPGITKTVSDIRSNILGNAADGVD